MVAFITHFHFHIMCISAQPHTAALFASVSVTHNTPTYDTPFDTRTTTTTRRRRTPWLLYLTFAVLHLPQTHTHFDYDVLTVLTHLGPVTHLHTFYFTPTRATTGQRTFWVTSLTFWGHLLGTGLPFPFLLGGPNTTALVTDYNTALLHGNTPVPCNTTNLPDRTTGPFNLTGS